MGADMPVERRSYFKTVRNGRQVWAAKPSSAYTPAGVTQRADAEYYVLFRLSQMGFDAETGENPLADIVACSREGSRVALLRVHARDGDGWQMRASDATGSGRNSAHVFVEASEADAEPVCFVVPAAVVAAALRVTRGWPGKGDALEPYRDAWHLLGLSRKSAGRSAPVVSPSSPSL
jgi:hypothetical protein